MTSKRAPAEEILKKLSVIQNADVKAALQQLWLFETQGSAKSTYKDFYRDILEKAAETRSMSGGEELED